MVGLRSNLLCSQNDDAEQRFRGFIIFGLFAFDEDYAVRYGRAICRHQRSSKLRSTELSARPPPASANSAGSQMRSASPPLWNKQGSSAFCDGLVRMHTIRGWIVRRGDSAMDSIIYLVGLIVVVMFILSVLGLH
jgi:hypothetical protein